MILLFLILGLLLGSFANVVVARFPKRQDLVFTSSNCPRCHRSIPWFLNIPVLGWFLAGGRCITCRTKIPVRYPLGEAAFGALFAVHVGWFGGGPHSLCYLAYFGLLLLLSLLDWETMRLYDAFTLPAALVGLAVSLAWPGAFLGGRWGSLLGAVCLGAAGWLLARGGAWLFGREALGDGDVKLLLSMGGFLGLSHGFAALGLAYVFGGFTALAMMLAGRARMKDPLPFGPFLAAGAVTAGFHLLAGL